MTFEQLGLIKPLLKALKPLGYTHPTPIQEASIPIVLEGEDLLGCAQTGTGKTAAFCLPMIQLLEDRLHPARKNRQIKSLIVTPTRELAIQIGESLADYSRYTNIKHTVIFGGVGQRPQQAALRRGVDILVATPGRLLDLMGQGYISLKSLEIFVLDEADRMLDMGFIHDVRRIIKALPRERQSLFFSATMPPSIVELAASILRESPQKVEVAPESTTAETVQQAVYFVDKNEKRKLLRHVLKDPELNIGTALVFTRTKYGADKVARFLNKSGIQSEAIHGNKSQNARQRALSNFKSQRTRVLVATDIAARGIDVDDLSHVINFEVPNVPETYVHRIGRTGRAGASGIAFSFCDEEEKAYLKDIQRLIGQTLPVVDDNPFPSDDQRPVELQPGRRQGNGTHQGGNSSGSNRRKSQSRNGSRSGNGPSNRNKSRAQGQGGSGNSDSQGKRNDNRKRRRWRGRSKSSGQQAG